MSSHRNNQDTGETPILQIDSATFQAAVTAALTAVMMQLNANNTNKNGNSIDNSYQSNNHKNQRVTAYQGTPNPKLKSRKRESESKKNVTPRI